MELKYTNVILGNRAFVLLTDEINNYNSRYISEEMYWLKEQGHNITLKINSPGGNVLASYNIIDAVVTCEADTHIIGIAASMAGVIAQFGKKRFANDNAIGMIHPPNGKPADLLEIIRNQLAKMLTDRSKFKAEEVTALLEEGGKDNFYDAGELLANGLVDEIVATNEKAVPVASNSSQTLYEIFNQSITLSTMDNLNTIKSTLGMEVNASPESVNEAIKNLQSENATFKAGPSAEEIAELKAENKILKDQAAADNAAKVDALVDQAIADNKIQESAKDTWKTLATENYDLAVTSLEAITVTKGSVHDLLDPEGNEKPEATPGVKGKKPTAEEVKAFKALSVEDQGKMGRENPEAYNLLIMEI